MLTTINVDEDCIKYAGSDVVTNSMQFYRTNSAVAIAIARVLIPTAKVMVGRSRIDIFTGDGSLCRIYLTDEQRKITNSDLDDTLAPVSFELDINEAFLNS